MTGDWINKLSVAHKEVALLADSKPLSEFRNEDMNQLLVPAIAEWMLRVGAVKENKDTQVKEVMANIVYIAQSLQKEFPSLTVEELRLAFHKSTRLELEGVDPNLYGSPFNFMYVAKTIKAYNDWSESLKWEIKQERNKHEDRLKEEFEKSPEGKYSKFLKAVCKMFYNMAEHNTEPNYLDENVVLLSNYLNESGFILSITTDEISKECLAYAKKSAEELVKDLIKREREEMAVNYKLRSGEENKPKQYSNEELQNLVKDRVGGFKRVYFVMRYFEDVYSMDNLIKKLSYEKLSKYFNS